MLDDLTRQAGEIIQRAVDTESLQFLDVRIAGELAAQCPQPHILECDAVLIRANSGGELDAVEAFRARVQRDVAALNAAVQLIIRSPGHPGGGLYVNGTVGLSRDVEHPAQLPERQVAAELDAWRISVRVPQDPRRVQGGFA